MGSPAIFSGNFAKFLKSNLNLFDQAYILTSSTNPTVSATNAPAGSILLYTVAGSSAIYMKMDAGSTTNWVLLADNRVTSGLQYEMLIDDWAAQSPYNLWTPNIVAQAGQSLFSSLTGTAVLNTTDDTITFGTIGDTATTVQQLDAGEFLSNPNGILADVGQVDLLVYWKAGAVDTAATYQVSRDGGNNYETVTMSNAGSATNAFYGSFTFTAEPSNQTLVTQASTNATLTLNGSTQQQLAQKFTVASSVAQLVEQVTFNVSTITGTPVGNLLFKIVRDSAGVPSTSPTDVLASSSAYAASTVTTGANTFTLPYTALPTGTYWVVIYGDATYTASAGANNFAFSTQTGSNPDVGEYNGTSWSTVTQDFKWSLLGRTLDLRLKITAGTGNVKLAATAVAYSVTTGVVGATNKRQVFQFNSTTQDLNTFTLTQFAPDANLLTVRHVESGLTWGADPDSPMSLQGFTIVFPAHFFNPDGVSRVVTLVANQNTGGSFNNSDQNSLLLAANHLGSTDPTIDKSSPGLGPILRRPDGTLRQLALDNFDNVTVSSVP